MAFPTTSLGIEVSIALDADLSADPSTWVWTDVSTYARPESYGSPGVFVGRGRVDEQAQPSPSSCILALKNTNGRFSPRNPLGPYYGHFGTNTPLRVRVDPGTGFVTRFTGFVVAWPQRWGPDIDEHVPIQADGVLRRLSQGDTPLKSALYRAISDAGPSAYWPMEDGRDATSAASGLVGGRSLEFITAVTPGVEGPIGSAGAADLGGTAFLITQNPTTRASVSISSTTGLVIDAWMRADLENAPADTVDAFFNVVLLTGSGSTIAKINIAGNGGTGAFATPRMFVDLFDSSGAVLLDVGSTAVNPVDGVWHNVQARMTQNGADVDVDLWVDGVLLASGTETTATLPRLTGVLLSGGDYFDVAGVRTGFQPVGRAHVAVFNSLSPGSFYVPGTGHAGERAGARFTRLCTEEGVAFDLGGTDVDTYAMGPQTAAPFLTLARECEAASAGVILERRTGKLGLDLTTARENQPVVLTMNYALGHVANIAHTDDDRYTRNDVTVTATNASSARVVDETGPMGVGVPGDPDHPGVGRYDDGPTINLDPNDPNLPLHHAGWRVGKGTINQPRFPLVALSLTANPSLIATWLNCDVGSRIRLTNLPDYVSFDDIDVILEGYVENLDAVDWRVDLICAPYRPYGVFELASTSGDTDEFLGRLIPESMELVIARDTDDTSWTVATNPKFTVDSDDYPIGLVVGGEAITATAASAVTPTFINEGTADHDVNAAVAPGLPASTQEGDTLLTLAAIRNSGTGVPDTPGGYTSLAGTSNMRLFGRRHDGSEAAPTITFTGGVAGADTSAQMAAFRGATLDVLYASIQLNASAQDIAYPELPLWAIVDDLGNLVNNAIVLLIAWKQDDSTNVSTPGGFTEIGDLSTATGDDQSLWWARQIQTTATGIAAGTLTVTGGAAAISRAGWVVLRSDVVTLTVTRSVNGVVKSHAQGASLEIEDAYVLGL